MIDYCEFRVNIHMKVNLYKLAYARFNISFNVLSSLQWIRLKSRFFSNN